MRVIETDIPEIKIIETDIFTDSRGSFSETFNEKQFETLVGPIKFVQDNQSVSRKGTIRGLHWQMGEHAQAKLVRCVKGRVLDVAVDIRKGSPTYLKHVMVELSAENGKQLFVPRGFAHGFIALENDTIFAYKCDNFYNKESERGMRYDSVDIPWPEQYMLMHIVSDKDKKHPTANELTDNDIFTYE